VQILTTKSDPNILPQDEETKFNPKSIYGIAIISSYCLLKNFEKIIGTEI